MDLKLFTKLGCAPCIPIKRIAESVEGCEIISLDSHPECIEQYGLQATPTLLNGTELITNPAQIIKILKH